MKFAIIAAGEGQRLKEEGVDAPKPLVEIKGEHLIDRLIRIFVNNGAEEICVICNAAMTEVVSHLEQVKRRGIQGRKVALSYVAKQTPSSMHSLYELRELIGRSPFVLTTVDTVFREEEFGRYVKVFRRVADSDGALMGVTDYVDDEKPLYVESPLPSSPPRGGELRGTGYEDLSPITGFYDEPHGCRYVSAGIYGLPPVALDTLEACVARGESRMRNFQRALVADGVSLRAGLSRRCSTSTMLRTSPRLKLSSTKNEKWNLKTTSYWPFNVPNAIRPTRWRRIIPFFTR